MARDTVQADRLEALLSGELAPEDVPAELAQLATLAESLRDEIEVPAPPEAFRAQLRTELLTTPQQAPGLLVDLQDRLREGTTRLRRSLRVAGATAVASAMIGTTGVAAAAQQALPGDLLYGLKGVTEDARMLFASDGLERGRLHLAFARERLEEVEDGIDRLSPEQFESALAALDQESVAGANLLLNEPPTPAIRDELDAFTGEMRQRLVAIAPRLPLSVRPATEHTLEMLRRIDVQARGFVDSASCVACGESVAGSLPRVVLPGDGPATSPRCDCVGDEAVGDDREDGDDGSGTDPDPVPNPDPSRRDRVDRPSGWGHSSGSSNLSDTVQDTGSLVDDVLDGTGDTVGNVTDQLGDTVEDIGESVGDTVGGGDTVEDTSDTVGDVVGDVGSTVGDTVDDVGSTVDDTVDDVGSTVEDTVDDVGGLLRGD